MNRRPRLSFVSGLAAIVVIGAGNHHAMAQAIDHDRQPIMVAGSPFATPTDSPSLRIDPNTTSSPFGGVGSIFIDAFGGSGFICTGTLITPYHVLTAGHCMDIDGNGSADVAPGLITFFLNFGSDNSHAVTAQAVHVNPDYTGFANPTVNDDMVVLELNEPIFGVPTYPLHRMPLTAGTTINSVGYGRSGTGVAGYTTGASFNIKRSGSNQVDLFDPDDEGGPKNEVFVIDFDAPGGGTGFTGGPSLGNDIETTFGGGDSGGPSFVNVGGQLRVAGVNTFISSFGGPSPPFFDSAAGGVLVAGSLDWLDTIIPIPGDANGDGMVTGADFTIWNDNFGDFNGNAQFSDGDFNFDGFVTGADFTIWNDNFAAGPDVAIVPEPAAWMTGLVAMALGLMVVIRKRYS